MPLAVLAALAALAAQAPGVSGLRSLTFAGLVRPSARGLAPQPRGLTPKTPRRQQRSGSSYTPSWFKKSPAAGTPAPAPARPQAPVPPRPQRQGSPSRSAGTVAGLSADVFKVPRGLPLLKTFWSCPIDVKKPPGTVQLRTIVLGRWLIVPGGPAVRNGALSFEEVPKPSEDCTPMTENELNDDQYAKVVARLMALTSGSLMTPREPKVFKYNGKVLDALPEFDFRGFESDGSSFVEAMLRSTVRCPDSFNLGSLSANENTLNCLAGTKVRPVGANLPWDKPFVIREYDKASEWPIELDEETREKLLGFTKNPHIKKTIMKALTGEMLLPVSPFNREIPKSQWPTYTYVASALRPSLATENLVKLTKAGFRGASGGLKLTQLTRAPGVRQQEVAAEVDRLRNKLWGSAVVALPAVSIGGPLEFETLRPSRFVTKNGPVPAAKLKDAWTKSQSTGLYYMDPERRQVKIFSFVHGGGGAATQTARKAQTQIASLLKKLGLTASVPEEPYVTNQNAGEIFEHFEQLGIAEGDLILGFSSCSAMKRGPGSRVRMETKKLCLEKDIATQFFDIEKSVWTGAKAPDKWSMENVNMAVVAKLGHAPFGIDCRSWLGGDRREVLAIGYDVCHVARRSLHIMAGTRVSGDPAQPGTLGKVEAKVARIDGELVPPEVLRELLPPELAEGRVVIVHRDGRFPDEEVFFFREYQKELKGTTFVLVEVIKSAMGSPRLYKGTSNAPRGTVMKKNGTSAVLATSDGTLPGTTANPLSTKLREIIGDEFLDESSREHLVAKGWLESVYDLSSLHFGSVFKGPRLPATQHFADRIAGIFTDDSEDPEDLLKLMNHGSLLGQFWL